MDSTLLTVPITVDVLVRLLGYTAGATALWFLMQFVGDVRRFHDETSRRITWLQDRVSRLEGAVEGHPLRRASDLSSSEGV